MPDHKGLSVTKHTVHSMNSQKKKNEKTGQMASKVFMSNSSHENCHLAWTAHFVTC